MSPVQKWPLQIVVGARDAASATLKRVGGVATTLRGKLRLSGISASFGRLRDFTLGLGRSFMDLARKASVFGGVAAGALAFLVTRITSAGDATGELAKKIGLNAETLQEWRVGAGFAGLAQEQFNDAIEKFSSAMANARTGRVTQLEVFDRLGVALVDSEGKARDLAEVLPEVLDGIKGFDPSARLVLIERLFGAANRQLTLWVEGGSAGMADYAEKARKAGAISTEGALEAFGRFHDLLDEIKLQFTGIATQATTALLPSIERVGESFRSWLEGNNENFAKWAEWLGERLPYALDRLLENLKAFWKWIEPKMRAVGVAIREADKIGQMLGFTERSNTAAKREANMRRSEASRRREREEAEFGALQEVTERGVTAAAAVVGALTVSFANLPRGARVTRDEAARKWTRLEMGWAMPEVGR